MSSNSTTARSRTCPTTRGCAACGCRAPASLLDGRGQKFAEVFEQDQRRVWVPLAEIPAACPAAFIAAEDKRFQQHRGIDERALIRAFIGNLTQSGPAAGRLDHHPAAGEEPAGRRRPLLRAQDARDDRRRPRRAAALQGRDPRALSQLGVPRPRLLGHRARGAQLFRQAGQRADAGGGRAAGGADQGAEFLQSRPPSAAGARPLRLRAAAHARGRRGRRRRGEAADHRRRADAGRLRAAAARHRVPFHRSGPARGAHASPASKG